MANKQNTILIEKIKKLLRKNIDMTYQAIAEKLDTYRGRIQYYMETYDLREVIRKELK